MEFDEAVLGAIQAAGIKPSDDASREDKKNYSERLSNRLAVAISRELAARGLDDCRPLEGEDGEPAGGERRIAGGIGAKKVDVSWTVDSGGLLLALSIKTISFRDGRTGNYQKNLANRRGDMLFETVTLHRRFPFAVIGGFFFLDWGAGEDGTDRRESTQRNAHDLLRLFTGRADPAGREEQLERLYVVRYGADPGEVRIEVHEAGQVDGPPTSMESAMTELLQTVADRNSDFYDFRDGGLVAR